MRAKASSSRRAGTSTAAVYELFGDKAGLVRELFFEGFRRLDAAFSGLSPSADPRADRPVDRRPLARRNRGIDPRRGDRGAADARPPARGGGVRFGTIPVADAEGAILAHSVRAGGGNWRKGTVLSAEVVAALRDAGLETVVAARLDPEDVDEDTAAERLARAVAGAGVRIEPPFTGRSNLHAEQAGVLVVDQVAIDNLIRIDPAITRPRRPNRYGGSHSVTCPYRYPAPSPQSSKQAPPARGSITTRCVRSSPYECGTHRSVSPVIASNTRLAGALKRSSVSMRTVRSYQRRSGTGLRWLYRWRPRRRTTTTPARTSTARCCMTA